MKFHQNHEFSITALINFLKFSVLFESKIDKTFKKETLFFIEIVDIDKLLRFYCKK
jgi:hypothetical protein